MAAIITGSNGTVAYWAPRAAPKQGRAFGFNGTFHKKHLCAFAGLSVFAANGNHGPSHIDGAVTSNAGMDLLFRIAGRR
ncbi:MAG: hypothetical protein P8N14_18215 [Sulfitobacter sp.]|jgi:hypothetical protein|nr:hypothetical protein [Sulfitobacter sp.]